MNMNFQKGDLVRCIAARDIRELTINKTYLVTKPTEEGIFPDRPFVQVMNDLNKPMWCHASRFTKITTGDQP